MAKLVEPYGGELVDLRADGEELKAAQNELAEASRLTLSDTALCDLELLATGGFSPLRGFMGRADYEGVVKELRFWQASGNKS